VQRLGANVLDETRAFNAEIRAQMARLAPIDSVPAEQTRRARREGRSIFGPIVHVPEARWVDADGVPLRVVVPEEPRGCYLHIHGGGWTLGAADQRDVPLRALSRTTGLAVASVEYRLAPEHPFPAARDDCAAAARWLANGGAAELGVPPVFAIGGESAGAHLSVLTMLELRGEVAFAAANLVYGPYDLGDTPSRRAWDDVLVLTDRGMNWFADNFLPGLDREQRRAPEISPLYDDLRGLPPALFTVGTLDPLLDDSLFMAARWEAAGNETELILFEEGAHGFNAFPIALGTMANDAQARFLSRVAAAAAA
jgi:acetyl esterase/lipase